MSIQDQYDGFCYFNNSTWQPRTKRVPKILLQTIFQDLQMSDQLIQYPSMILSLMSFCFSYIICLSILWFFTNEWSIDTISINDSFPDEFLFFIHNMPWYTNVVNYLPTSEMPSNWNSQDKKKFLTKWKVFTEMIYTRLCVVHINVFRDAYQTTR